MAKTLAVIDYGVGNLRSVEKAWEYVGADARIVSKVDEVRDDDILVFPGQGAISDAMSLLKSTGFDKLIKDWVANDKPFFGICLGLQALFEHSEEGNVDCLGIFKGKVKRLNLPNEYKVPHMGWNNVEFKKAHKVIDNLDKSGQFYFVHSYYVDSYEKDIILSTTQYGGQNFVSSIQKGNLMACQFHPEKSQSLGLELYRNFLNFFGVCKGAGFAKGK